MRANLKIFARAKTLAAAGFVLVVALHVLGPSARAQVAAQRQTQPGARQAARPRDGKLVRRLNLTPAQRLQLREIRSQREPEARELARRVRLARRALDEAIYADAAEDALVEQRARELASAQAALVRLRAATELKVRRVLTAEQLQTFRELRRQAQQEQRRRLFQLRPAGRARRRPARRRRPGRPAPLK
jgi:Spy/CpxP family protein refolding chaperone